MIDSHCHLADESFLHDLDAVVGRARSAGLVGALCIIDATSSEEVMRIQRVSGLWPEIGSAVGVHPHQASLFLDNVEGVEDIVRKGIQSVPSPLAIGEIGLDYHYDFSPRQIQLEVFRRQISLARELRKPIVVHTRDADKDTLDSLREEGQGRVQGVIHCFTGDQEFARRVLDIGFYVSFSGIVTFRRSSDLRKIAATIPADRLLVETDAPYLAPVPFRGRRNEPAWVSHVIDVVSEARGINRIDTLQAISSSYTRLFAV